MTSSNRWPLAIVFLGLGFMGGVTISQRLTGQPAAPADPPLPRDWMSFSPVVKRVLPAVVCIEGKGKVARAKLDDPDPGFGSGFIIDPTGIVMTNNHVVADTTVVEVTLQDGRKFTSKDIRRDPKADLAVIKLETQEALPFLEFTDSSAMEVGDRVLAVGAPFGLTGSVTSGIVSAKSRNNLKLNLYEDFLQTDAPVNPGNSGGPLVNMQGKVVGLTAAIKTRTGGFQGVGLAVSSNLAKSVAEQLVKHGVVRRPYLGVLVADLDEATAAKYKIKLDTGVVVTKVFDKSPGAKANIGVGDIITSVNGRPVPNSRELQKTTLELPVGQVIDLHVMRDGKLFLTRVTVENQPDDFTPAAATGAVPRQPVNFDGLGLVVNDLTPEVAARNGVPREVKGVIIAGVAPNGLAAQSGLARGMIVVKVDQTPVMTADSFKQAVEQSSPERGAVLHVLRPSGDVDFVILRTQ